MGIFVITSSFAEDGIGKCNGYAAEMSANKHIFGIWSFSPPCCCGVVNCRYKNRAISHYGRSLRGAKCHMMR